MSGSYSVIPQTRTIKCFEGAHHPLGPSGSKRWLNCPGSVNACKDATDPGSEFAAEGTAAHTLSEVCRVQGEEAESYKGWTIIVGDRKFVVDDEMIGSVQEFIEWCAEVPGEVGLVLVEHLVHYGSFAPGDPAPFGTLDDGRLAASGRVTITDFKHGKGVQEYAERNTQLMLQALGVLEEFGYLYDIREFDLRIAQPRLDHKDSWVISVDDLLAWALTLPGALARVREGRDFKAGEWCRFCRIKRTCGVRAAAATAEVLDEFQNLDAPTMQANAKLEVSLVPRLSPSRVAEILPSLDILSSWLKDIRKHAIALLVAGEKVGDWKLVEGRSNRAFSDKDAAAAKLQEKGIDPWDKKLLTPSKLEKAHGKKAIAAAVGDLITKPHGKPKLAPGGDKRPPVTTEILNEFGNLDAEDDDEDE